MDNSNTGCTEQVNLIKYDYIINSIKGVLSKSKHSKGYINAKSMMIFFNNNNLVYNRDFKRQSV
jgi:hypothetical protein